LTEALHVLQLQLSPLTTSIILSYNKIQNGDVLVPAYRGCRCRGRWPSNEWNVWIKSPEPGTHCGRL